ncbi:hypothetical protein AJ80_01567 [Polytolypa hystricis UAMH7299]|uniref:Uncharacterized protein n=1 Tax=Polytolypa hystricis (strain UAMH7299) TaxID=1447883 RepID=A0A2B7Z0F5_POLH7|nr:hypothetical protein AJ80_01567 [Polytolypa hystricis UAMH7299]
MDSMHHLEIDTESNADVSQVLTWRLSLEDEPMICDRSRTPSPESNLGYEPKPSTKRCFPPASSPDSGIGLSDDDDCPSISPPDSGIGLEDDNERPSISPTVSAARNHAMQVLAACRSSLLMHELTRMRKARVGFHNWMAFWRRIYDPAVARALFDQVSIVFPKIDKVFQEMSERLYSITRDTGERMMRASSDAEIFALWEEMERWVITYRRFRQLHVKVLLENLRCNLERIPVDVPDGLWDDLKRGVFALDSEGNYHPGDPQAEKRDEEQGRKPQGADVYIRFDPNLVTRPGFNDEFRGALQAAVDRAELDRALEEGLDGFDDNGDEEESGFDSGFTSSEWLGESTEDTSSCSS